MPVEIQNDAGLSGAGVIVDETLFEDLLKLMAQRLSDPRLGREVCVRICDEAESRQLNATYRQTDKSTNVLSFAADVDLPEAPLGDLAICLPVVVREAAAQHKTAQDHLAHLFVHGVLHLLDYDHADDDQAQAMETLEVEILAAAGLADPYRSID